MSQVPPGYVSEVVFNARVHALEVRLAVLEGRAHSTSTIEYMTLALMAQKRDTAIRERDAARAATATAVSDRDAARQERDTAVSERDTARRELDAARASLALLSAVTPNMLEEYDRIRERLSVLYNGTRVGDEWEREQEEELGDIYRAFANNHRSEDSW